MGSVEDMIARRGLERDWLTIQVLVRADIRHKKGVMTIVVSRCRARRRQFDRASLRSVPFLSPL